MRPTVLACLVCVQVLLGCSDKTGGDARPIGGIVSGLVGAGLVLQNNAGDDQAIAADGAFVFATPVAVGGTYAVTVLTQPSAPAQTCMVTEGSGDVAADTVAIAHVACTTDVHVGGVVSGLLGTGLVLENNGGDDLAITANGPYIFATPLTSGTSFSVTVAAQPANPSQLCTVSGGTGTIGGGDVTANVECVVSRFTVGGTVSGLLGAGLVLQNNAGDDLAIAADDTFTFATALASGTQFAVTTLTQPSGPTQQCTVDGGTGSIGGSNVVSVTVNCSTNRYAIGGTITGLLGTGLVLQNTGGDDLPISGDGTFAFATTVPSGSPYAVTVLANPSAPTQTCLVTSGGSGLVVSAAITDVVVTCTTNQYMIGGMVSGLAAGDSVVLRDNATDDLTVFANGTFTFPTAVSSGAVYSVSVFLDPASPISQTCLVANASGIVGGADVIDVMITCTTNQFTVGGSLTGFTGTGLVLQNNAGDDLAITGNGPFTFATAVASGQAYDVTIKTTGTTCSVVRGAGTMGNASVTDVDVTCGDAYYVNAVTGNNANPGTAAQPWKTITFATGTTSAVPVTIFVAPGLYDFANGEVFPIRPKQNQTLIGDEANKGVGPTPTQISGGGGYTIAGGAAGGLALTATMVFAPGVNAAVRGFQVIPTTLETVIVDGATATLANNTLLGSSDFVLPVLNGSDCTVTGNAISSGPYGVLFGDSTTRAKLRGNTISGLSQAALNLGYVTPITGSQIDFGTAGDPGNNTILRTTNGYGLNVTTTSGSLVPAVGNTWSPNVQGADAAGHYAAQAVVGPVARTPGSNYSITPSSPSGLQF